MSRRASSHRHHINQCLLKLAANLVDCGTRPTCRLALANFAPTALHKITDSTYFRITKICQELDTEPHPNFEYFVFKHVIPSLWRVGQNSFAVIRILVASSRSFVAKPPFDIFGPRDSVSIPWYFRPSWFLFVCLFWYFFFFGDTPPILTGEPFTTRLVILSWSLQSTTIEV